MWATPASIAAPMNSTFSGVFVRRFVPSPIRPTSVAPRLIVRFAIARHTSPALDGQLLFGAASVRSRFGPPSLYGEAYCGQESEQAKPDEDDHRDDIRPGSQCDGGDKD